MFANTDLNISLYLLSMSRRVKPTDERNLDMVPLLSNVNNWHTTSVTIYL